MRRAKLILFLFLALTLSFGVERELGTLQVVNRGDRYIHAQIGDVWVLFIPPKGSSRTLHLPVQESLPARAIIAPGEPDGGEVIADTVIFFKEGTRGLACEMLPSRERWVIHPPAVGAR